MRVGCVLAVWIASGGLARAEPAGVTASEFVFERAPFPSCHASTIAETPGRPGRRLVRRHATRGPRRRHLVSPARRRALVGPVEVADGEQADGRAFPCWNPVLFQPRRRAAAALLQGRPVAPAPGGACSRPPTTAAGPGPRPRRLPDGILGPIKNKPVVAGRRRAALPLQHRARRLARPPRTHARPGQDLDEDRAAQRRQGVGAIQPTILSTRDGTLQILCRSRQGSDRRVLVAGRRQDLGPMRADRPAQPQQRHRRRDPQGRPRTCSSTTTPPRAAPR